MCAYVHAPIYARRWLNHDLFGYLHGHSKALTKKQHGGVGARGGRGFDRGVRVGMNGHAMHNERPPQGASAPGHPADELLACAPHLRPGHLVKLQWRVY